MLLLICVLILLVLLGWLAIFYIRKTKHFNTHTFPMQLAIVNELLDDLKNSKIYLSVCSELEEENAQSYTLFEVAEFIDNNYRFSNEAYDEYALLFTDNKVQIIEFDKYILNPMLPKVIKDELQLFYNKEFYPLSKSVVNFFKIDLIGEAKIKSDRFFEGTGEAFESWLTFKESADNLKFMINQWLSKSFASN